MEPINKIFNEKLLNSERTWTTKGINIDIYIVAALEPNIDYQSRAFVAFIIQFIVTNIVVLDLMKEEFWGDEAASEKPMFDRICKKNPIFKEFTLKISSALMVVFFAIQFRTEMATAVMN